MSGAGWIVGTRTAGDQASTRRCLIPLDKVTMIEEGHGGGIVVHLEGQMPEVLTEPGFEEILAGWTEPAEGAPPPSPLPLDAAHDAASAGEGGQA